LDAEEELRRGPGYTPTRSTLAAVAVAREQALCLLAPNDIPLDERGALPAAVGPRLGAALEGVAWCPTPRALAQLRAAGATPPDAPALEVLRRVNASRFPYDVLDERLPGACVARRRDQVEAWLAGPHASAGAWVKRAFGAAGRAKLRVSGGALAPHVRAFLTDDELGLGVVLEPDVAITLEVSQHGWLAADGGLTLGWPCVQRVERGRFDAVRVALPGEVEEHEQAALRDAAQRLAQALHREGYFGAFGVDAYRYDDAGGVSRWNPCGELNARYTMGYALGMAGVSTMK
jgi:hypothetical protein